MRKLMMISVTVLLFGVASSQAQTPDMSTPTPSIEQKHDVKGKEWAKVESAQIPAGLQQTLKEDKYTGWETMGVYYNKSTNQYSADTKKGTTASSYRFDANGQIIDAQAASPNLSPAAAPNR